MSAWEVTWPSGPGRLLVDATPTALAACGGSTAGVIAHAIATHTGARPVAISIAHRTHGGHGTAHTTTGTATIREIRS